jgi:hypothetical protein
MVCHKINVEEKKKSEMVRDMMKNMSTTVDKVFHNCLNCHFLDLIESRKTLVTPVFQPPWPEKGGPLRVLL